MIIIVKQHTPKDKVTQLIQSLEKQNFKIHLSEGQNTTIIGLVGDTSIVDINSLKAKDIVEDVRRVSEPYKKANRKFHNDDTIVEIGGKKIGKNHFAVIAGPCSVESQDQILEINESIKNSGANFLRGGAFKPRTSPYAFQGLQDEGINILLAGKKKFGLPLVSEIMDISDIPLFQDVDVIQVGAR
ncbi:MAG: 3-deoxy-7-phosphoheptulonate synthase, partial [Christensenellaceae bacterium]